MITGHQIRAARALLEWSAEELAKAAKVNRDTVHNIEKGATQGQGSIEKIVAILIKNDIEFIGDRGVAIRHDNYRILEGSDCYLQLLDEVYHTLREKPDAEVLSICTDDSVSPSEVVTAIRRWHEAGIKCRFLSHEKATRFDFPLQEYRLISSSFFKNSVMVVYADKVATLRRRDVAIAATDDKGHSKKTDGLNDAVLIINDQDQADMLRGLFELIWSQASKPAIAPAAIEAQPTDTQKPKPKQKK